MSTIEKVIDNICYDYHIPSSEVLCKTSAHYATSVKAKIAYVLITHYKLRREKIAQMFKVHPYSVWRYKQLVEELIKKDPKLEDTLKKYRPSLKQI
jgi:hypothetical protein